MKWLLSVTASSILLVAGVFLLVAFGGVSSRAPEQSPNSHKLTSGQELTSGQVISLVQSKIGTICEPGNLYLSMPNNFRTGRQTDNTWWVLWGNHDGSWIVYENTLTVQTVRGCLSLSRRRL